MNEPIRVPAEIEQAGEDAAKLDSVQVVSAVENPDPVTWTKAPAKTGAAGVRAMEGVVAGDGGGEGIVNEALASPLSPPFVLTVKKYVPGEAPAGTLKAALRAPLVIVHDVDHTTSRPLTGADKMQVLSVE